MVGFKNNNFILMNKDKEVLYFTKPNSSDDFFEISSSYSMSDVPIGFTDITSWLSARQAPKHRQHIEDLLRMCDCLSIDGFIRFTHALSLNDTFWVKPVGSNFTWNQVSLYSNNFNEVVARIAFEGGMYGRHFSSTSPEFTTDGTFAKCWKRLDDKIYLLKTGSTGASNAGLEPYSEYLASQLGQKFLGEDNSVLYNLYDYFDRKNDVNLKATRCELFTSEHIGFVQAQKAFNTTSISINQFLELYKKYGSEEQFRKMLIFDALILNCDRHAGNHGLLFNNDSLKIIGMSPVFDNNMSFMPYFILGTDDLGKYITQLVPKIGLDFNLVAHDMLTPSLKRELNNLRGFRFDRTFLKEFSESRLRLFENIIDIQISNIINGKEINENDFHIDAFEDDFCITDCSETVLSRVGEIKNQIDCVDSAIFSKSCDISKTDRNKR